MILALPAGNKEARIRAARYCRLQRPLFVPASVTHVPEIRYDPRSFGPSGDRHRMIHATTRCAFLSMDSMTGYVCDDDLAIPALAEQNVAVTTLSWRDPSIRWDNFDWVIVRSAWDYLLDSAGFFARLAEIEASSAQLANPLASMRWNADKHYLADLEKSGVAIVPTHWGKNLDSDTLDEFLERYRGQGVVVKPVVSANAYNTFHLDENSSASLRAPALTAHKDNDWMLQPFVRSIVSDGEYSLFFFAGEFSHCIVKKPADNDFRVQEEHGGQLSALQADADMLSAAHNALSHVDDDLLYARVDLVRNQDQYQLMELEIIEPSLYFRLGPGSPTRFAHACRRWFSRRDS